MEDANLKIKPLLKEQIIISIDRLTRFKCPEEKYLRVFYDIILHNLIEPKYNRSELENLENEKIMTLAQDVINFSLDKLGCQSDKNFVINKKLFEYENSVFKFGDNIKSLLTNKINYFGMLQLLSENDLPDNLRWFKALNSDVDIIKARRNDAFRYPIEILVLTEGATEETLLPEFAKLCNFDFEREGVYLLPAGGKNQVVKAYYELSEYLKIPVFVLFDNDGKSNAKEIEPKLRTTDEIYIIECGEFEDLLTQKLFERALNYELQNISIPADTVDYHLPRVKILEDIFKKRGMHELKKVEFAKTVKKNILSCEDVSPEMRRIIEKIKKIKLNNEY